MEIVTVLLAMLVVDVAWFIYARRRNRRECQAKMDASLRQHVNSSQFERDERYGK